ncbi:hypothetical protein TNCV_664541 [Trichonephila clavipes]|nr:hypothetical protein TNCV_664541 [Trichonephila clavipes]
MILNIKELDFHLPAFRYRIISKPAVEPGDISGHHQEDPQREYPARTHDVRQNERESSLPETQEQLVEFRSLFGGMLRRRPSLAISGISVISARGDRIWTLGWSGTSIYFAGVEAFRCCVLHGQRYSWVRWREMRAGGASRERQMALLLCTSLRLAAKCSRKLWTKFVEPYGWEGSSTQPIFSSEG